MIDSLRTKIILHRSALGPLSNDAHPKHFESKLVMEWLHRKERRATMSKQNFESLKGKLGTTESWKLIENVIAEDSIASAEEGYTCETETYLSAYYAGLIPADGVMPEVIIISEEPIASETIKVKDGLTLEPKISIQDLCAFRKYLESNENPEIINEIIADLMHLHNQLAVKS